MPPAPTHAAATRAPLLLLAVGVAAISTGSIFARLADAPALDLAFWRCAIATLLLLPFARRALVAELPRRSARELAGVFVAGAVLALHFATWIASLSHTSVASSVLLVNTGPVWAAILSRPLTGERVRAATWLGVGLCLLGCLIIAAGDLHVGGTALYGDALALVGGFAASLYLLLGRRLRATLSLGAYLPLCYGSAALTLGLALTAIGRAPGGYPAATWGWILGLALIPQLVGHSACNLAVRRISATLVSLGMTAEPLLAGLLAWWLLSEEPRIGALVGAPLILAAVWIAARAESVPGPPSVSRPPNSVSR